jgi:capsular polysaccharide biosynthesis protein
VQSLLTGYEEGYGHNKMKLISDTLFLPPIQYESRTTCIEGYDYPPKTYNKQIDTEGIHVLQLADVAVVGIGDIVDSYTWTPIFGHQDLLFFPPYVEKWHVEGKRQRLIYDLLNTGKNAFTCLQVDSVATTLHFNCNVYGHFLLEIVPKLFVLKEYFKKTEIQPVPPIALPSNTKAWVKNFILEIWPECSFLWFDPHKELIIAKYTYVVAGQLLQQHPGIAPYFLSFAKNNRSTVKSGKLLSNITSPFLGFSNKFDSGRENRKILLTRPKIHFSRRKISNFSRLKKIALNKGYEIIEPKSFGSLKEQANFFNQCSVVLGEFTSALHNTVFSPGGTIVGCMNYRNYYQESIAAVMGHNLNYVLPDSGPILKDAEQSYIISEQKFSQLIDDIEKRLNS